MQKRITIVRDAVEPETVEVYEAENVIEFLMTQFGKWPETAKLYHGDVCTQNDVTPGSEDDIQALLKLEGEFTVIVYPGYVLAAIAIIALFVVVATTVLKKKPNVALDTATSNSGGSSNNSLSDRSNKGRPNERLPDIYGEVRAVPDLLGKTFFTYSDHKQIEHAFMCLGRGSYNVGDIREDQTLISEIEGSSVEIYGPGNSPNTGAPQLRVGDPIGDPVRTVIESSSISQQTLFAPNGRFYRGTGSIGVSVDGHLFTTDTSVNFNDLFETGDTLTVTASIIHYSYIVSGVTHTDTMDIGGTYIVGAIGPDNQHIAITNYAGPTNWGLFATRNGVIDSAVDGLIVSTASNWVGPFLVELPNINEIIANFVAASGLYKSDGTNYYPVDVTITVEVTPVDVNSNPVGAAQTYNLAISGSSTVRTQRAGTLVQDIGTWQRVSVRARRVTDTDTVSQQVSDTVVWQNLYGSRIETIPQFGNCTTVLSLTKATDQSTAIGSRKLNMLAQRLVRIRNPDNTVPETLWPSNNAADIITTICLDPVIGHRTIGEIDVANIYDQINQSQEYFGTNYAADFCYTFDDKTLSFEETIAQIADAAFCTAYRQGLQIKLFFEKQTEDSTLLFNHRNKIPNSETRTVRFGSEDDYNGIEFTYVDPGDEATITLYIPTDKSATNAKQVTGIGVRNNIQAHFHAWRLYQKMLYQNVTVEFTGTAESKLLVLNERVLVADNTRSDTQDGEIVSQTGLVVETSQPLRFDPTKSYSLFLQYSDQTVEAIDITPGTDAYHAVLAAAPEQPLSVDPTNYARTTYIMVAADDTRNRAFLLSASDPQDNYSSKLTLVNYSDAYYVSDKDFINGLITYQDYVDNGSS